MATVNQTIRMFMRLRLHSVSSRWCADLERGVLL